ncbi:unnamed protein product [Mytilus edulis]|uniref:Uncharacterized protein n=1 Tax=Mytilus edulis TaxID=6550 RepID=A0A8S3VKZ4_MYTED|nr:unnamed protein product [Mytilus edulis]
MLAVSSLSLLVQTAGNPQEHKVRDQRTDRPCARIAFPEQNQLFVDGQQIKHIILFVKEMLGKQCGFEELCEIKTARCYRKPCTYETYCVPTWGSLYKGGACPAADDSSVSTIRCVGDFGCGISNNDVCCHNPWGSSSKGGDCPASDNSSASTIRCFGGFGSWGSSSKGGDCPASDNSSASTIRCFGGFGCLLS